MDKHYSLLMNSAISLTTSAKFLIPRLPTAIAIFAPGLIKGRSFNNSFDNSPLMLTRELFVEMLSYFSKMITDHIQ